MLSIQELLPRADLEFITNFGKLIYINFVIFLLQSGSSVFPKAHYIA